MKCSKCNFNNPKGGNFCQKCGTELTISHIKEATKKDHFIDDLDDIIFTPKKKRASAVTFIAGFLLLIITILATYIFLTLNNTQDPLDKFIKNKFADCLLLEGAAMHPQTEFMGDPLYEVTLDNTCNKDLSNVVVQVKFFSSDSDANSEPIDTVNVTLIDYIRSRESMEFFKEIETDFDTSTGEFKWLANIHEVSE